MDQQTQAALEALEQYRKHASLVVELRHEERGLQDAIARVEAEIKIGILAATNPDGKPTYPNETAREAEYVRRKLLHTEHKTLTERLRGLQRDATLNDVLARYYLEQARILGYPRLG